MTVMKKRKKRIRLLNCAICEKKGIEIVWFGEKRSERVDRFTKKKRICET
jgi:hypothetical protein